ncbi:unnamed protein product [Zymoseptoria tritici ST99CH_1E4]|uniref:Uncharacterized protein n=1 Tax=Zymoseptoria tritici ST99CH_1E4 TaxID=1276532 RepID=A0A2H1HBT8_ZYMTR|nr:unnamed protein product [Zymoseptoria tritici ST99CH_1E4]
MSEYGSRHETLCRRLRSGMDGSRSPPHPSEHLTLAEWVLSRDDASIFESASHDEAAPQIATPRLAAEDWQRIHRGLTSSSRPPPLRIKTAVDISPVSRSLTRRPSAPASLMSGPTAGVYSRSAPGLMEAGASPPTFGPSLDPIDMPLPWDGHEQTTVEDKRNPDAPPHDPPSSSTVAPHTPPPLPSAPDSRMWQPTTPAASSTSKVEREIAEIIALQGEIAGSNPDEPPSEEALARYEGLRARLEELQSREADGAGDGANDGGCDDGGGDDGLVVTGVHAGEPDANPSASRSEKTEASTTDRPGHFAPITTPTPAGKHRVAQRRHSSASIESSMSPFVGEHAQPPQQQSVPCSPSFRPTFHTETPSGFSPVPSPCPQPKTSAGKNMNKHTNQPSKRRSRILPTIKLLVWFPLLLASLFIFHPPHLPATYLSYPSLLTPTASSPSDPHTRAPPAALIDALLPTPSQAATTMTTGTMELALRLAAVIAGHRAFLAVQGFATAASPAGSKISDPDLARQHAGLVELEGAIQGMVGLRVGIGGWEDGAGVDIEMERMRARMVRIASRLSLRPGEGGDGVNSFVEEYLRGVLGWERG